MVSKALSKQGSGYAKNLWILSAVAIVLLGLGFMLTQPSASVEGSTPGIQTYPATEGPLWITIVESGTIEALDQVVLKSEVEGRVQVLWLVAEGKHVEEGDLLVRLDSSALEDRRTDKQISLQGNESRFIWARENLDVTKSNSESSISEAELALQFAKEDLDKYIEGDFPNQLKAAESRVTLMEASKATAADDLHGKQELFEKDFVTPVELDTAKRRMQRAELNVELAKGRMELLQGFTYKRTVTQLQSDLEEAKRNLERTRLRAAADIVQAQAALAERESGFQRETRRLEKLTDQIKKCEIYAPTSGSVLYATRSRGRGHRRRTVEPLEKGQDVRERQEVIHLRTGNAVVARVSVDESDLGKVKPGQRVRITVEALPGKEFTGHVASIGLLPDSQDSRWMGGGSNVYATEITVDGDNGALRAGMSCQVEIVVEHHQQAVSVPVAAVLRVQGRPTVYVVKGNEIEERTVEIGMANKNMIRISANLAAGEHVLLTPPLERATVTHKRVYTNPKAQTEAVKDTGKPGVQK